MQTVDHLVCTERHRHIDSTLLEHKQRQKEQQDALTALEKVAERQTSVAHTMMEKLTYIETRLNALEHKPQRRMEKIYDVGIQWATLLVLGLLAARLGL